MRIDEFHVAVPAAFAALGAGVGNVIANVDIMLSGLSGPSQTQMLEYMLKYSVPGVLVGLGIGVTYVAGTETNQWLKERLIATHGESDDFRDALSAVKGQTIPHRNPNAGNDRERQVRERLATLSVPTLLHAAWIANNPDRLREAQAVVKARANLDNLAAKHQLELRCTSRQSL